MLALADPICDRFECAWRAGDQPRIEDYLAFLAGPERSILFRELLAAEIELRREGGDTPDRREYESRFPEHRAVIGAAFEGTIDSVGSWHIPETEEAPPSDRTDPRPGCSEVELLTGWSASDPAPDRQGDRTERDVPNGVPDTNVLDPRRVDPDVTQPDRGDGSRPRPMRRVSSLHPSLPTPRRSAKSPASPLGPGRN